MAQIFDERGRQGSRPFGPRPVQPPATDPSADLPLEALTDAFGPNIAQTDCDRDILEEIRFDIAKLRESSGAALFNRETEDERAIEILVVGEEDRTIGADPWRPMRLVDSFENSFVMGKVMDWPDVREAQRLRKDLSPIPWPGSLGAGRLASFAEAFSFSVCSWERSLQTGEHKTRLVLEEGDLLKSKLKVSTIDALNHLCFLSGIGGIVHHALTASPTAQVLGWTIFGLGMARTCLQMMDHNRGGAISRWIGGFEPVIYLLGLNRYQEETVNPMELLAHRVERELEASSIGRALVVVKNKDLAVLINLLRGRTGWSEVVA